jgi:cobalamin 5'-phosphate synthase/cobalamin synthase
MPAASVRAAAGAVSFLTRVPVGRFAAVDGTDVARGAVLFPVVGAAVGALSAGAAALLHLALPAFVAGALGIAVAALVTGALHLDALADTFDAVGAPTKAEALAIMRDPRLGPFGATALMLDLLVKVAALAFLLDHGGAIAALAAAGALSRAVGVLLARLLPYVQTEAGAGGVLSGRVSARTAALAVFVAAAAAAAAAGLTAAWLGAAAAGAALVLALAYRSWLGGVTGDTLGAATELSELAVIVVAAAVS